jgi:hypothetical protein
MKSRREVFIAHTSGMPMIVNAGAAAKGQFSAVGVAQVARLPTRERNALKKGRET